MTSTRVTFASEGSIEPALRVVRQLLTESPQQHVWLFYGHAVGEHPEALEQALALKDQHLSRLSLGVVTDQILIRAVNNWGAGNHTCFYRVRLYGDLRDDV